MMIVVITIVIMIIITITMIVTATTTTRMIDILRDITPVVIYAMTIFMRNMLVC